MTVEQMAPVLNEIVSQATGRSDIQVTNTNFVSVAQTALQTGYDPLSTAISQVLTNTIFSARPYAAKFSQLQVSEEQYGNHVRKLQTLDSEWEEDDRLKLEDGESIDMYKVHKPKVVQTNFYDEQQFQRSLTVYRDQLDTAFSNSSEFGRFLSMVMQNAVDQITQAKEETSRATVNNLISGVIANGKPAQVVDVLAVYNEYAGTSLTRDTLLGSDQYPNFVRWLYGFIQTTSDMMTERSVLYHQDIAGKEIMRHTPKADQRLYLYSPIVRSMESMVTSTTYHDDKLVFPNYEPVNYWQSISSPTMITTKPHYLNDDGSVANDKTVTCDYVLGVLFDREAAGVCTVNEWGAATPFNARGGYYNQYWHFTERYWNDFSENVIVFTLGE